MPYTIGEVSKMFAIAPSALRYYDKEGLFPFIERTGGGVRLFREQDLSALRIIECLKQTGMPISEIKKFMELCAEGDSAIDARLELINRQYAVMLERLHQTMDTLHMLEYKQWYYTTAKDAGTCSVHDEFKLEDIPERFRDIPDVIAHFAEKTGGGSD